MLGVEDRVRIRHMRDAALRAIEISHGRVVESLDPDSETALALTRLLEILGEAARHVSEETTNAWGNVPWRLICGMRNRIVHKYFDVDFRIVASVIGGDLPLLVSQLDEILKEPSSQVPPTGSPPA